MSLKSHPPTDPPPVQFTRLEIGGFGIRAQADARTGLDAWRIIRKRHPWVTWLVAGYAALMVLIVALGVTCLL